MEMLTKAIDAALAPGSALPVLVYGPSHSGKKTLLRRLLRLRGLHVLEHSTLPSFVQADTLHGRAAHLIDCNSLALPKSKAPGALLFYVQHDPFERNTRAELLRRFQLVELKQLRHIEPAGALHQPDRSFHQPPWLAVQQLRSSSLEEQELVLEKNPQLPELLRNNALEQSRLEFAEQHCELNSSLDLLLYRMPERTRSLLIAVPALHSLSAHTQLRYSGWPAALSKRAPLRADQLWVFSKLQKQRKRSAAPAHNSAKRRAAPQCRHCSVPMKGHRCPKKGR
jgi:hypothetical protein